MRAVHARVERVARAVRRVAGLPARRRPTAAAAASRRPGWCTPPRRELGTDPSRCVLVGDIGRDVAAAPAAGAAGVLVPTPVTRPQEIAAAAVGWPPICRRRWRRSCAARQRRRQLPCGRAAPTPGGAGTVLVVRLGLGRGRAGHRPADPRRRGRGAERVVLLCGPRGRAAAELLPGVDEIIEHRLPWIDPAPGAGRPAPTCAELDRPARPPAPTRRWSSPRSTSRPCPWRCCCGWPASTRIAAISDDYPGSLLDVRHRVPVGVPEPERALSLAAAAGSGLPDDDGPGLRLRRRRAAAAGRVGEPGYVVLHPGSAAPARACPPELAAADRRGADRRRAPGAGHRRPRRAGAHRRGRRRPAASTSAGAPAWPGWPRSSPAPARSWSATPAPRTWPPPSACRWSACSRRPSRSGSGGPTGCPPCGSATPPRPAGTPGRRSCPVPGHPCLSGVDPSEVVDCGCSGCLGRGPAPRGGGSR